MNAADVFLLLLILAAVTLAVRKLLRDRRQGRSCCGDCASCRGAEPCRPKAERNAKK